MAKKPPGWREPEHLRVPPGHHFKIDLDASRATRTPELRIRLDPQREPQRNRCPRCMNVLAVLQPTQLCAKCKTETLTFRFIGSQLNRNTFVGSKVATYGRLWLPRKELDPLIRKHGAEPIPTPESGAYLVLSPLVAVEKDPIGLEYEVAESPVTAQIVTWIRMGAIAVPERALKEVLTGQPSSLAVKRAKDIERVAQETLTKCDETRQLLDELLKED